MVKELKTGVYYKGEESFGFDFYIDLTIADKLRFVKSVTSIVVDDKDYNSIIRDLVFDFYVVDIFTTIDTTDLMTSKTFLDDVEKFFEETNIVDVVKANVPSYLFDELNKAIDKSIEYKTGIHPNPLGDALTNLVDTLERKIDEVDLSSMMEMANVFSGITGELTPESIVNAYMKSDMHKNNLKEIKNSKEKN